MSDWLHITAVASLIVGAACSAVVLIDIVSGHRQKMRITDIVWPITPLYSGPIALAAYFWLDGYSALRTFRRDSED